MLSFYVDPLANLLGDWAADLSLGAILLRLSLSVLCAAVVGFERASKRHSAGLRTFILVSLAACVAMLLDLFLFFQLNGPGLPLLSAATIIGTAMISGNSILFNSRNQIRGLTTSAGLWTCGLLGLALGAGFYSMALSAFVLLLCILTYLPAVESWLTNRSNHFEIHLELKNRENLQDFVTTIRRLGMRVDDIESNPAFLGSGLSVYTVLISIGSQELKKYKEHKEIIDALSTLEYVYHIEMMK